MEKLVSIILPTYNGTNRIREAIRSVISQTYKNWELLVIDDGSVDGTEEVVSNLVESDKRIKYIKNENNLGIQKSLNKGIREAKGEYIARIDDDDTWCDANKLKEQVEFLEKNSDHVLVGTGFIATNEKGEEVFRSINPQSDKDIRRRILNKSSFLHSSVIFRKDSAVKYGGYSELEDTKHIEDYDLWLKLGTIGKFANLAEYSVRFTLREGSISSKNKIIQFKKSIKLIKKYKNLYPNYTQGLISLYTRMVVYMALQFKPFRHFSSSIYRLYKNI